MSASDPLAGIHVIDTDTHWSEPHDLWTSRVPASQRERVPHVVEVDGKQRWVANRDVDIGSAMPLSVVRPDGSKAIGLDWFEWGIEDTHAAAYDVTARLAMMDRLGIFAQVVYPNVAGFGNQNFHKIDDLELRLLCARTYNDAMAEVQEQSGGRLFPMALMPWWDIPAAVEEAQRVAEMGMRGVVTTPDPYTAGYPDLAESDWDPFWGACSQLGLPVNFHIGASDIGLSFFANAPWPSLDGPRRFLVGGMDLAMSNARVLSNLIVSGVPERFPELKFVSVESGIGWLPFYLEMLDYQMEQTAPGLLSLKPSEIFRRQVYATFWFEDMTPRRLLGEIGVNNVMFETDFPHATCLYPDGQEHLRDVMAEIDEPVRRRVLQDNAAELYRIDLPPAAA
ncbi:MAG: amidohydrolase [Proteobacteria bacterium]|nr:amidohydrolase [Pseudomonadota bacterium]